MPYQFLVDTYETESIKVVSVWSEFRDDDLDGGSAWLVLHDSYRFFGVMCCSIAAAIRTALFLAWSAIVPVKRSSTVA